MALICIASLQATKELVSKVCIDSAVCCMPQQTVLTTHVCEVSNFSHFNSSDGNVHPWYINIVDRLVLSRQHNNICEVKCIESLLLGVRSLYTVMYSNCVFMCTKIQLSATVTVCVTVCIPRIYLLAVCKEIDTLTDRLDILSQSISSTVLQIQYRS